MAILNYKELKNYIVDDVDRFFMKYKSENTKRNYINSLNKILKDIFNIDNYNFITKEQVESLNLRVLTDYFNELSNITNDKDEVKYKNSTLNRHISVIKEFIKFLNAWDVIEYDVSKLDALKSFPDTREEIDMIPYELAIQFSEHVIKEYKGIEKSLIIKLAIDTALRAEELLTLTWDNFTIVNDGVIIKSRGDNKGKGNKEWIDKIDINFYNELLKLKNENSNKLFTLTYRQLNLMMEKLNLEFNCVKKYTFHGFKKLAVTMCYINNGNCIDSAQKKARHSNVTTTMRYLKLENTNINGIISTSMNVDNEIYKKCSHEELLIALSEMRVDFITLLNNKIKKLNERSHL